MLMKLALFCVHRSDRSRLLFTSPRLQYAVFCTDHDRKAMQREWRPRGFERWKARAMCPASTVPPADEQKTKCRAQASTAAAVVVAGRVGVRRE
jgi:hypothetical protein